MIAGADDTTAIERALPLAVVSNDIDDPFFPFRLPFCFINYCFCNIYFNLSWCLHALVSLYSRRDLSPFVGLKTTLEVWACQVWRSSVLVVTSCAEMSAHNGITSTIKHLQQNLRFAQNFVVMQGSRSGKRDAVDVMARASSKE